MSDKPVSQTTNSDCMWCRYGDHPSGPTCPIHQRPFTDAEHAEIMRLHIVEGLTITEAMILLTQRRIDAQQSGDEGTRIVQEFRL